MTLVPPCKNLSGYGATPLESGELLDSALIDLSGFSQVGHVHGEYITGNVIRPTETGAFASTGWVNQYYYPRTNPSGYGAGGGGGGISQPQAMAISSLRI